MSSRITAGEVRVKRAFDLVLSAALLIILAPLLLTVATLVKLDSPGPVLFRQRRLGHRERVFEIFKFRTMQFRPTDTGASITGSNDTRVTRVGRILRRYDLDELPTLLNVLKGQMSIVGPRAEAPKFLPYYTREQRGVFSVKPGLTDPATLAFRHEAEALSGADVEGTYVRDILPRKLAVSLQYVTQQSFFSDLRIVFRTLATIVSQPKA